MSRKKKKTVSAKPKPQQVKNVGSKPRKKGPIAVQPRHSVASNVRSSEVVATLSATTLGRVVTSIVQYALSKGWLTPEIVTGDVLSTPKELYYGIYDDLLRACRPTPSHYLVGKGVPLWYRELFEGLSPGHSAPAGGSMTNYKWTGIPEENGDMNHVLWAGAIDGATRLDEWSGLTGAGTYALNGSAPTPTHDNSKDAVMHFFGNCLAAGHQKWMGGKTVYLDDTSAFAYAIDHNEVLDTNVNGNVTKGAAIMAHETKIVFPWLAGLQLVDVSVSHADRFSAYLHRTTAGPSALMGHQLIRHYTGYQGGTDRLHFPIVDIHKFELATLSLINGTKIKARESTSPEDLVYPFSNGDYAGFRAMMTIAYQSQLLSASPVMHEIHINGLRKMLWGTNYMKMTPRTLERITFPTIIMENLRMYHPSAIPIVDNKKKVLYSDFYYPIAGFPDEGNELEMSQYNVWEWTDNTMDMLSITDPGHARNFENAVGSKFKDYLEEWKMHMYRFQEYHGAQSAAVHHERQLGAQLMLMSQSTPVVFTKTADGVVCIPVEEALNNGTLSGLSSQILKYFRTLIDSRDRAVAAPSIFENYFSESKKNSLLSVKSNKQKWVQVNHSATNKRACPITLGVNTVIPGNGKFDLFKQMVLPRINVPMTGCTNNTSSVVAMFGLRDTARVDSAATVPYLEIMNSFYEHTSTRGSHGSTHSELMRVLRGKTARGLGAGVAAPYQAPGLGSELVGGEAGGFIDGVMGVNPYMAGVNEVGGYLVQAVKSLIDPERQAMRQERRQKRKEARRERREN